MTFRPRRPARPGIGARVRALFEGEERQQATVTVLFIGAIVLVVLALLGAVALAWYKTTCAGARRLGRDRSAAVRDRVAFEHGALG
jgi:hypothetical protein